jgi:uncharacterized protein (DUF433 family)
MADEVKRVEGPELEFWRFEISRPEHGTVCGALPVLRALLLSQGLHIVGEAEVRVLGACELCLIETNPSRYPGRLEIDDDGSIAEAVLSLRAGGTLREIGAAIAQAFPCSREDVDKAIAKHDVARRAAKGE